MTDAGVVTTDLIARARAGDGDAFRELTEPHRRELHVHCYRMLGSFQDAEDAVQDALLAAWHGLDRFEERASIRTWLYRITTNRCLNVLRTARRRPAMAWDVPGVEPPEPTRLGEIVWLEPYPDALADISLGTPPGPDARYEQTEAISLAFVAALQMLPPRQVAVLILRDVLGFRANEVAGMLDATGRSVNSALKRARASLERRRPPIRQARCGACCRLTRRECDCREVRERLRVGRSGRAGRVAHRRRVHFDAADSARIPGPRCGGAAVREHLPRGQAVRPRSGARQRPAGVRGLPSRIQRHPSRSRPRRSHARRRQDLRVDAL